MGKRKAKAKPPPKKAKEVLPSSFDCLFCNHEKAVSVTLDRKAGTGELSCKVCGQQFQTAINSLSDHVDVYSDWVDACDAVAKEAAGVVEDDDFEAHDTSQRKPAAVANDHATEQVDPDAEDYYD